MEYEREFIGLCWTQGVGWTCDMKTERNLNSFASPSQTPDRCTKIKPWRRVSGPPGPIMSILCFSNQCQNRCKYDVFILIWNWAGSYSCSSQVVLIFLYNGKATGIKSCSWFGYLIMLWGTIFALFYMSFNISCESIHVPAHHLNYVYIFSICPYGFQSKVFLCVWLCWVPLPFILGLLSYTYCIKWLFCAFFLFLLL